MMRSQSTASHNLPEVLSLPPPTTSGHVLCPVCWGLRSSFFLVTVSITHSLWSETKASKEAKPKELSGKSDFVFSRPVTTTYIPAFWSPRSESMTYDLWLAEGIGSR